MPQVTASVNTAYILQMNDPEPLHILQMDDETEFPGIRGRSARFKAHVGHRRLSYLTPALLMPGQAAPEAGQ